MQAVLLYDFNQRPMSVLDGVAIPASTSGLLACGSDGTNAKFMRVAADGTVRIDPTGTTTQPVNGTVTANLGTIAGVATDANLDEKFGDLGQKANAGSAPVTISSDQTGSDNSANGTSKVTTIPARANAAAPAWTEGNQAPLSTDLLGNQRTKLSGVQSAGNSTTAALGSNAVFTGTWEDISDVASVQFIAFADQASAASGFSIQWSPDGVNADVTEATALSASVGRAFSLTPRGRFFRIVYTNGAVAQGAFRLRTVYHVNGVGLISRLMSATITEDNFAQNVRAFLAGKNAAGNFNNLVADADNSANAAIKLATIVARANAADPAWTEGNQVPASTDLSGFQRAKVKFNTPTTAALSSASINAAANGDNTLVAGVAAQTVRVFQLFLVTSANVNIKFKDGAGTDLTAAMSMTKGGAMVLDFNGEPWFVTSAANAFILNLSAAQQVSGRIYYTQS